jgi:branched-chain amino acid transport system substrate-binding protein
MKLPPLCISLAALGLLSCLRAHAQDVQTPSKEAKLKVGIILPLSGESASVGQAIKNGITLAWEKLPAAVQSKLELVYEDDQILPKLSVNAFRKLAAENVGVVINAGSASGNALAPLAEQHQVPTIAIASDPQVVRGRKYIVNLYTTPETEARVAIEEALRRGYRRVARIMAIHDWSFALKKAFDQENRGRIEIVLDEEYPTSVKDFKTFIAKLRSKEPIDAILVLLYSGQNGVLAKQVRQQGIKAPLFAVEMFEDSSEVEASEGALIDQWYVNSDDPDNRFVNLYRGRFPNASLYGASSGHDAMLLIGTAVERSTDLEEINRYLHTVKDFEGASGTFSSSGDNRFTLPSVVKVVTKDGFKKL